jgi:hypothetical protein
LISLGDLIRKSVDFSLVRGEKGVKLDSEEEIGLMMVRILSGYFTGKGIEEGSSERVEVFSHKL